MNNNYIKILKFNITCLNLVPYLHFRHGYRFSIRMLYFSCCRKTTRRWRWCWCGCCCWWWWWRWGAVTTLIIILNFNAIQTEDVSLIVNTTTTPTVQVPVQGKCGWKVTGLKIETIHKTNHRGRDGASTSPSVLFRRRSPN